MGEAIAVRVGRVHLDRRRVSIAEAVADDASGAQVIGTPKGHERREVPVPAFLVDLLRPLVEGRDPDRLLFTSPTGRMLSDRNVVRDVDLGTLGATVGVPGLKLHELRHTAASLAIDAGASVKVVQRMLGHKSAAMTLDLYGHLFDDRLDEVSDALDRAAREAGVYPMCTDEPASDDLGLVDRPEMASD